MKLKNILITGILALAGVASAHAYTQGDLILSIWNTSNSSVYEVDLGNKSNFLSLTAGQGISTVKNIGSDLATVFGTATWYNDPTLEWSIAGVVKYTSLGSSQEECLIGNPETTSGTQAAGNWAFSSNGANKTATNQINNLGNTYTTGVSVGSGVEMAKGTSGSIATYITGASQENGTYNTGLSLEGQLGNATNGTSSAALDLFDYSNSTAGTYKGTFTINNSGVVSYEVVPEPSTYAMMVAGGLGFLGMLRRRNRKA
jgi:hypothetical protein